MFLKSSLNEELVLTQLISSYSNGLIEPIEVISTQETVPEDFLENLKFFTLKFMKILKKSVSLVLHAKWYLQQTEWRGMSFIQVVDEDGDDATECNLILRSNFVNPLRQ